MSEVARKRFEILERAERSGNVSQTCIEAGIDRTRLYKWRKRFRLLGMAGLENKPREMKPHPRQPPPETEEKILTLASEFPGLSCSSISKRLEKQGIRISPPTVQKILAKNGLARKARRFLAFEERVSREKRGISPGMISQIEKWNPAFRERHKEVPAPGELLIHGCFSPGTLPGLGKVFVQAIVDSGSLFGFLLAHIGRRGEFALAVLHNDVIPFFREKKISIERIQTDRKPEFFEEGGGAYQRFLKMNGIGHDIVPVPLHRRNGIFDRFRDTVLREFFKPLARRGEALPFDRVQIKLDYWLHAYNFERGSPGFPNFGSKPFEPIREFLKSSHGGR